jgi:hypothetical protein
MKLSYRYGFAGILVGLLLVFASLYFEILLVGPPVSAQHSAAALGHTALKLLEVLGVAIFGIGFLNIMLETKDWRDYFEDRIKHLVVEQEYLKTLDKDTFGLHPVCMTPRLS